jgi:hypothetical protein
MIATVAATTNNPKTRRVRFMRCVEVKVSMIRLAPWVEGSTRGNTRISE